MTSSRAKERLSELSMEEAAAMEKEGRLEEAAALYDAIGTDAAEERAAACRYQLADQIKETGDLPAAARAFEALGEKEAADACWDEYYGDAPQKAQAAMEKEDYFAVVMELEALERSSELNALYQEAAYLYAEKLYDEDKPYEALPFYQRAVGYRDTKDKKLERRAYLILGQWESTSGKEAVFNPDGTCELLGEKLYFRVNNFSVFTGVDPDSMTVTHKLSAIDKNGMSLRDISTSEETVYKFTRKGEFDLPSTQLPLPEMTEGAIAEETPATEENDESAL